MLSALVLGKGSAFESSGDRQCTARRVLLTNSSSRMCRCVVVASALDFAEESLGLALGFAWLPRFLNVFEGFGDESRST